MKFLEIKTDRGFVRFALDNVIAYGIVFHNKKGKKPEHCMLTVELNGKDVSIEFSGLAKANEAINIIDV